MSKGFHISLTTTNVPHQTTTTSKLPHQTTTTSKFPRSWPGEVRATQEEKLQFETTTGFCLIMYNSKQAPFIRSNVQCFSAACVCPAAVGEIFELNVDMLKRETAMFTAR